MFRLGQANETRRSHGAVQQRDEADEAKHIGASQLIPGVRRTTLRVDGGGRRRGDGLAAKLVAAGTAQQRTAVVTSFQALRCYEPWNAATTAR